MIKTDVNVELKEPLLVPGSHESEPEQSETEEETLFECVVSTSTCLKYSILVWLTLQNSIYTLLLRYSRARPIEHMYSSSVAVICQESLKLIFSIILVLIESGGISKGLHQIQSCVLEQPWDTARVGVLAVMYTMQNNLVYVAASHLDVATFMVTSQLKIFTTVVFAVLLLRQNLSRWQCAALVMLFAGVCIVQLEQSNGATPKKSTSAHFESPAIGFSAVIAASVFSGFSGIYFERILKGMSPVSVWLRNVQLAVCSIPTAILTTYVTEIASLEAGATQPINELLFRGFDFVVWLVIFWIAIGGLTVAAVIKYADNILKNFATAVAILISTAASVVLFKFELTVTFMVGAGLVIVATYVYGAFPPASTQRALPLVQKEMTDDTEDSEYEFVHDCDLCC